MHSEKKENMKNDIKEFIPIGILDLIGIVSIIQVLTTNYVFTYRQYIGLSLLLICTLLFFKNRKIYKYLTAMTLIVGLTNIIGFSTSIITVGISIIQVQLIPLIVLFIYVYIFQTEIKKLIEKPESEQSNNINDKLKERFKQKFEKLSDKEIESRLNQNLVPEAISALEEIQTERK